ncbi:hypothetical protein ACSSLL_25830, partial [Escherichia coli]
TDRERSERAARRASEASQSPLTAIFKEELVRKYGLFFSYIAHTGCPRPRLLGRGEIVHINCLIAQSTIKKRKRVQNIYALSGHFL